MITRSDVVRMEVTDEQVAFYHANGFLVVEGITTQVEVERLRTIFDQLLPPHLGQDWKKQPVSRFQYFGPQRQFPELRDTLCWRNACRITARLLTVREEEVFGGSDFKVKPAGYSRATPWHQDEAYWSPGKASFLRQLGYLDAPWYRQGLVGDPNLVPNSLSVWLPLDPATAASGGLWFIPGSHRHGLHRHRHAVNDPTVDGLWTDQVDPDRAVACPVPVGGASFHDCRTLHYCGPNTTGQPRRVFILRLSGPPRRPNPVPQ